MDDLIKRSAVIDVLKETSIIQDNDLGHLVVDEIERIPVAYDVEKVASYFDSEANKKAKQAIDAASLLDKAIMRYRAKECAKYAEIVRNGGVE